MREKDARYHCLQAELRDVESQRAVSASRTMFICEESASVLIWL